jgi:hypothetical protein
MKRAFKLLGKLFGSRTPKPATPPVPRIDFLLNLHHGWLEAPNQAYGGLNFLGLTDRQLAEGQIDLAARNIGSQIGHAFELANLYWGQGKLDRAEQYLQLTLERHRRVAAICAEQGWDVAVNSRLDFAKCAAFLLGEDPGALGDAADNRPGYDPWFKNALMAACLGAGDFPTAAWQASADLWTKRRFPRYRLDELDFYVKALTGKFASTDAMFASHRRMFAGRAKRAPDWDQIDGYRDNDLVIDYLFAAVLKRIGWEGEYRHSWPATHSDPAFVRTLREPDRFLVVEETTRHPSADAGLIAEVAAARAYLDRHLPGQIDEQGEPLDARRPASEVAKLAAALSALGWHDDAPTLALMTSWRMDRVLNDSTHLVLCDPLAKGVVGLGSWTRLLVEEFGMHPEFIAIAGSEDKRDYRDPQGGWHVYWKKDGQIHLVQRDEWDRPELAVASGQPGLTLWPSYVSFVAWWVGQHRTAAGSGCHA